MEAGVVKQLQQRVKISCDLLLVLLTPVSAVRDVSQPGARGRPAGPSLKGVKPYKSYQSADIFLNLFS